MGTEGAPNGREKDVQDVYHPKGSNELLYSGVLELEREREYHYVTREKMMD